MSKELVAENKAQSKTLKIRIYPDSKQITIIEKTFGCCRFIYNNYLQEKSEFYVPLEERKLTPVESSKVANLAMLALQATVSNETGNSIDDLEQKVLA